MSNHHDQPNNRRKMREKILAIAAGGICIAVAHALSLLKIFEMPQGGSVTPASMLPIVFFALCFGIGPGLAVAFIFSILQMLSWYMLHPAQVFLDYILAFSMLGLAGFFAPARALRENESNILNRLTLIPIYKIFIAVFIGVFCRLVCSVLSGVIFYASYAPEGQSALVYSFIYNGSFLLIEFIITVILLMSFLLVYGMIKTNKSTNKSSAKKA